MARPTTARKPNIKSATIKENYAHNSITIITMQTAKYHDGTRDRV